MLSTPYGVSSMPGGLTALLFELLVCLEASQRCFSSTLLSWSARTSRFTGTAVIPDFLVQKYNGVSGTTVRDLRKVDAGRLLKERYLASNTREALKGREVLVRVDV